MTKEGILLFAYNNESIDYVKMAVATAYSAKYWLEKPVSLITNTEDFKNSEIFDQIIIDKDEWSKDYNIRKYRSLDFTSKTSTYYNTTRSKAYDWSPYDKTLLIDSDYYIQTSHLKTVFDTDQPILINKNALTPGNEVLQQDVKLDSFGVPMYWMTCVYFNKSEFSKMFFDMIEFVKNNWNYYKILYNFKRTMFRNDYAASIAIHLLNNMKVNTGFPLSLPYDTLVTSVEMDKILEIEKGVVKLINARFDKAGFTAMNEYRDMHIMNKFDYMNNCDKIIEIYKRDLNV